MYSTFGHGAYNLKDTIGEHARMHEQGIAHSHRDINLNVLPKVSLSKSNIRGISIFDLDIDLISFIFILRTIALLGFAYLLVPNDTE